MSTLAAAPPSKLPTDCPAWCDQGTAGHVQALEEIGEVEGARIHLAADLVGQTAVSGQGEVRWGLSMRADPGRHAAYYGEPILKLETHTRYEAETLHSWHLTTGAARVLARQLLHFADLGDLTS